MACQVAAARAVRVRQKAVRLNMVLMGGTFPVVNFAKVRAGAVEDNIGSADLDKRVVRTDRRAALD
jgi:hypothetical protein